MSNFKYQVGDEVYLRIKGNITLAKVTKCVMVMEDMPYYYVGYWEELKKLMRRTEYRWVDFSRYEMTGASFPEDKVHLSPQLLLLAESAELIALMDKYDQTPHFLNEIRAVETYYQANMSREDLEKGRHICVVKHKVERRKVEGSTK